MNFKKIAFLILVMVMVGTVFVTSAMAMSYTAELTQRTWDLKCTGDTEQIQMVNESGETVTVSRKSGNDDNYYEGDYNYNGVTIKFNKSGYNRPNSAGVNLYSNGGSNATPANHLKYTAPCAGTLTVKVKKPSDAKFQAGSSTTEGTSRLDQDADCSSGTTVDFDLKKDEILYMYNACSNKDLVTKIEEMTFKPKTTYVYYTFTTSAAGASGKTLDINATYDDTQTKTFRHEIDTTITGDSDLAVMFDGLPAWVTVNSVMLQ